MTTPLQIFQKLQKEDMRQLAITLSEPWMQRCLVAALAQTAMQPMGMERMAGVLTFIETLHSLTEERSEIKSVPSPTLPTYDHSTLLAIEEQARKDLQKPITQA